MKFSIAFVNRKKNQAHSMPICKNVRYIQFLFYHTEKGYKNYILKNWHISWWINNNYTKSHFSVKDKIETTEKKAEEIEKQCCCAEAGVSRKVGVLYYNENMLKHNYSSTITIIRKSGEKIELYKLRCENFIQDRNRTWWGNGKVSDSIPVSDNNFSRWFM